MSAPSRIAEIVKRFEEHKESYSATSYNETQLRQEFLNPFFEALGWDISNRQGFAEAYKEVIHEDAVKIGTATKAPDYSFRVGGTCKFFVEASIGRIFHIKYDEYIKRWGEIASIFSKDSVLEGSFDWFAETGKPSNLTLAICRAECISSC